MRKGLVVLLLGMLVLTGCGEEEVVKTEDSPKVAEVEEKEKAREEEEKKAKVEAEKKAKSEKLAADERKTQFADYVAYVMPKVQDMTMNLVNMSEIFNMASETPLLIMTPEFDEALTMVGDSLIQTAEEIEAYPGPLHPDLEPAHARLVRASMMYADVGRDLPVAVMALKQGDPTILEVLMQRMEEANAILEEGTALMPKQ